MRNIYIGIIVILVFAVGIFVFVQNRNASTKELTSSNSSSSNQSSTNASVASDSVTITYTGSGFSPSSVTLKAGGKLTVTNSSSNEMSFNSDPHPSHTANSELNIGTIAAGGSKSVTLNNVGSWGYHNHLDASQTGTIIVK